MWSNLATNSIVNFLVQTRGHLLPGLQRHKGIDPLPFEIMRHANNRGLSDRRMAAYRAFNFRSANAMTRYVDHVIHTASDPVIPVFITSTAVAGEVLTGIQSKVRLTEPL